MGDRLAGADPGAALVGTSTIAGAAALIGFIVARLGGDKPGDADRVQPATLGLEFGWAPEGELDERMAPSLSALFAPQYNFAHEHGRARLFGRIGGTLGSNLDTDPRPQFSEPIEGQDTTFPQALRSRSLAIDVGFDMAVRLPYPVLPPDRAIYWGRFEVRYQPKFHVRRDALGLGDENRTIERAMLLPLNVGFRWYFAPRQRVTFYVGPRFDIVNVARRGERLQRAAPHSGPFYAEAWYDLDLPFSLRPRADGRARTARVNALFTLGYVHSRFDGRGLNIGPAIGFLGPLHIAWLTKVRPRGSIVAWQFGVRAAIGVDVTVLGQAGVALPELGAREGALGRGAGARSRERRRRR